MKHIRTTLLLLSFSIYCFAQNGMHVKQPNLTSFGKTEKHTSVTLDKLSTAKAKQHPEYGLLPFNAQCKNCVELIDERTIDSRRFIDPDNAGHTYSQKSLLPLHYQKFEGDIWRTLDPRLQPSATPGLYTALNQPTPTTYNSNTHECSIEVTGFQFAFNRNLKLFYFKENEAYTKTENASYSKITVGEEGVKTTGVWEGIDMEQLYSAGEVKTNFIINKPLQLPITEGWLVIEDNFSLPAGYTFEEAANGEHTIEGYYKGNYLLKDNKGETLFTYEKPSYVDARAWGQIGCYQLLQSGNQYTLRMLVPVNWLTNPANVYPLIIDPIITGRTKLGDFRLTAGGATANFGFTTKPISCDYHMNVVFPGQSTLTNAYVDLEYQLTYDNQCGVPPLPAPFCTFSQVSMEVVNDTCGTTTGLLSCNPATPPFTGTCTTDSNLVPGANSILINNFVPNFMSCYAFQCPDYSIPFTLKNRDSICGDACGYLCARGNMWQMTIEATKDIDSCCLAPDTLSQLPGSTVTLTAHNSAGPPVSYIWHSPWGTDTTSSPTFSFQLQSDVNVYCELLSYCGNTLYSGCTTNASYVDAIGVDGIETPGNGINSMEIKPNPNQGEFAISFNAYRSGACQLIIYNAEGQVVYKEVLSVKQGANQQLIRLPQVPKGLYIAELKGASEVKKTFSLKKKFSVQ